jgi:DHA1 family tetracycline resistance protein-like MFS transporter
LAGACIAFVLTGLASSLWPLCAARALAGLFGGSISTAQAYIADVTPAEQRAKYMGLLGASIGTGFAVGPALGVGILALGWGFAGAAFVAAALAAGNFLLAAARLTESRPPELRALTRPRRDWASALRRPQLRGILLATLLTMVAFVTMETTFALLGKARFELDSKRFGLALVLVTVVMVVVQGGLIGRLTRRYSVRGVAIAGALLMAVSLVLLPFAPSLPLAIGALALLGAGLGCTSPTLSTLLSTSSGDEEQGSVLGVGQSFSAAARAGGPLLAGALYDLHFAAPYLVASALAALAATLLQTKK